MYCARIAAPVARAAVSFISLVCYFIPCSNGGFACMKEYLKFSK